MSSRKRKAVILGVLLAFGGAGVWFGVNRNPYAFLEKYHPKIEEIPFERQFPKGAPSPPVRNRLRLYVFDSHDATAILAEMKAKLNPSTGYDVKDDLTMLRAEWKARGTKDDGSEQRWTFLYNPEHVSPGTLRYIDFLRFYNGLTGGDEKDVLEQGWGTIQFTNTKACIVVEVLPDPWLAREWHALRERLHL